MASNIFGTEAYKDETKLRLIGYWQDICAYYVDDATNTVWQWYNSNPRVWSNCGELDSFVDTFAKRRRGILLSRQQ